MKRTEIIGLLFMIIGSNSCRRSENLIGLNENILHDDFKYRVTAFEKRRSVGTGKETMDAGGIFFIVTFVVENDAARVSHKWDNSIAYLVSDDGKKFENDTKAQQVLNSVEPFQWKDLHITPYGTTENTRLVFDVPAGKNRLYLKVRGSMLMGDVFNLNRFKRIGIRLY